MWDVYLSGSVDTEWRKQLKEQISKDIKIFDPVIDNYEQLSEFDKSKNNAHEISSLDCSAIVVFYFDEKWNGSYSLLEMGESAGKGKQVIVCIKGKVKGERKLKRYCQYHGMPMCDKIEDLVTMIEEYLGELALIMENEV